VVSLRRRGSAAHGIAYEQHPPPQHAPPACGAALADEDTAPVETATIENSFTVSSCPLGHAIGADDSAIGRVFSNVSPHARQRYS
jgi:hypothetical protein